MRRSIIALLIISSLASATLRAQFINETPVLNNKRMGVGAFSGTTLLYPLVDIGQPIHFKPRANVMAGVDVRYTLNKRTSLHLQPTWLGTNNGQSEPGSDPYITYSLTMAKVPLLIRYYIPDQKLFFIQAGASYNYLVNARYSEQVIIYCITAPCPVFYNTATSFNRSSVSALAGFGFNLELQKMSIPIVLQYERSVSNYTFSTGDSYSGNTAPGTPLHFHTVSLSAGVSF